MLQNGSIIRKLHKNLLFAIFLFNNKLYNIQTYVTLENFKIFDQKPIKLIAFN